MQIDIVMDKRITYQMFLFRCLNCIISSRVNPFSEQSLQKHLNPLIQKVRKRKQQFQPVLLEVFIKTHPTKEIIKIEEWSFSPTSLLEDSVQSIDSEESFSSLNKNVFGCKLSSKVYKQLQKRQLEFNLVLHKQLITPLEGDNVFEAPIQYFQFENFNCTVSLVYNYQLSQIQEQQFHILAPSSPPVKQASFRKFSEGLQNISTFTLKTQQISKQKVSHLKELATKLKFQSMKEQTIQNTLNYLGLI